MNDVICGRDHSENTGYFLAPLVYSLAALFVILLNTILIVGLNKTGIKWRFSKTENSLILLSALAFLVELSRPIFQIILINNSINTSTSLIKTGYKFTAILLSFLAVITSCKRLVEVKRFRLTVITKLLFLACIILTCFFLGVWNKDEASKIIYNRKLAFFSARTCTIICPTLVAVINLMMLIGTKNSISTSDFGLKFRKEFLTKNHSTEIILLIAVNHTFIASTSVMYCVITNH